MFRTLRVITTALLLGVPALASGQAGTAVITGTIRDASGGTVPGAVVRIVNEQTRGAVDAVTDEQGAFRRDALPAGAYRVEIALSGFETAVRQVVAGHRPDRGRGSDARRRHGYPKASS